MRVCLSCDDRVNDTGTSLAAYVGKHARQLEVGVLKNAYHAVVFLSLLLHQPAPVTGQVPQGALVRAGHETAFEQSGTNKLDIQAESFLSVLCHGTYLMCRAFTTII